MEKVKKIKATITTALFVILIATPYLVWPFCKDIINMQNAEKRELAEKPVFDLKTFDTFPVQYEEYSNDHLPFRSKLIELNSALYYYGLHSSVNESVVPGKDGWLFYAAEDSTAFYNGRKQYTTEQLQLIADNVQTAKDHLEEQGIQFVLYIAPNKEHVYYEYLPDYYSQLAEETALQQVLIYLHENTNVTVVCPLESLLAEKQLHPDRILYRKTDTHWNNYGGYLGVCELLQALEIPYDEMGLRIFLEKDEAGDLAQLMNLSNVIYPGDRVQVEYPFAKSEQLEHEYYGHYRYCTPSQNTGCLLMVRDSFGDAMAPALSGAFAECDMVHRAAFSAEIIEEVRPDIFVYEVVERSLDLLLYDPHWIEIAEIKEYHPNY